MQLLISEGFIAAIVAWGMLSPASMAFFFDVALAAITRGFGSFYLWVVLAPDMMSMGETPIRVRG